MTKTYCLSISEIRNFRTAIHNPQRRNAPSNPMVSFELEGAVFRGIDGSGGYCIYGIEMGVE